MAALPQPFGIIPTGCPLLTTPTSIPSSTQFLYTLPARPYSHIVVYLQPGIVLPDDTAAAVYLQAATPTGFRFLGAIGAGKESAIFRIKNSPSIASEIGSVNGEVTLGISIEPAASVATQMAELEAQKAAGNTEQSLVLRNGETGGGRMDTTQLAQRIIKNAFNFLASFSGNLANGVEVVPLKAFEEWWRKFEGRVKSDPGFLERQGDGD